MSVLEGLKPKAGGNLGTVPLDDAGEAGGCKTVWWAAQDHRPCSSAPAVAVKSWQTDHCYPAVLSYSPMSAGSPQTLEGGF